MIGEKAADNILGNTPMEPIDIDYYQHNKLTREIESWMNYQNMPKWWLSVKVAADNIHV